MGGGALINIFHLRVGAYSREALIQWGVLIQGEHLFKVALNRDFTVSV